ncbi:MAG TPA: hypothetical protein VLF89_07875 [Candidatus Saccharimonadales bacterium]|nr:hypothetical protein [Candidatus Saccharimonadales bacterium]
MNLSKEFQPQTEVITVLPILDNTLALSSREFAKDFVECSGYPIEKGVAISSLELAIALSFYNAQVNHYSNPSKNSLLLDRWENLIQQEYTAQLSPQLPPIGIELESHIFPDFFKEESRLVAYKQFFDRINFPENEVNKIPYSLYWEFAPPPSYSAEVQETIKRELVTGRFISIVVPPFNQKDNIDKIAKITEESLNPGLLSLHGNLNIPEGLSIEKNDKDLHLFSMGFALATTSSLRLEKRPRDDFHDIREGEKIKPGFSDRRLEVCGLELNDKINLKELQLVASALFSYKYGLSSELGQEWRKIRIHLNKIIGPFINSPTEKEDIASLASKKEIVNTVNLLLNKCARNVDILVGDLHH